MEMPAPVREVQIALLAHPGREPALVLKTTLRKPARQEPPACCGADEVIVELLGPLVSEPVVLGPGVPVGVVAELVVLESVLPEPVVSDPAVSEPVVSEPVVSELVVSVREPAPVAGFPIALPEPVPAPDPTPVPAAGVVA